MHLLALIYFLRGTTFIYNGQEALDEKQESLFDVDLVCWDRLGDYDLPNLMKKCSEIKKDPLFKDANYDVILEDLEVAHLRYESKEELMEIVLNVGNVEGKVKTNLTHGLYQNLFDGSYVEVTNNEIEVGSNPIVLKERKY